MQFQSQKSKKSKKYSFKVIIELRVGYKVKFNIILASFGLLFLFWLVMKYLNKDQKKFFTKIILKNYLV